MTKEKQKSDEEPKKKRQKKPLIVGSALAASALAAAAGLYALTGNEQGKKEDAQKKPEAGEITRELDAGIILESVRARVRAATAINASNAAELARQGNIRAAEFIDDEYGKVEVTLLENFKRMVKREAARTGRNSSNIWGEGVDDLIDEIEEARKKVLEEFGISKKEYETISDALSLREHLTVLDYPPEYSINDPRQTDSVGRACEDAIVILDDMARYDPFNPTFLALIGMDKPTLQQRVRQIIETSRAFGGFAYQNPLDLEYRLRQAYKIE